MSLRKPSGIGNLTPQTSLGVATGRHPLCNRSEVASCNMLSTEQCKLKQKRAIGFNS